jgi:hypothetical protein
MGDTGRKVGLSTITNKSSTMTIVTHAKIDTEYCADACEFCPIPQHSDIISVGTYQVIKSNDPEVSEGNDKSEEETPIASSETKRTGRLLLYRIGEKEDDLIPDSDSAMLKA